MELKRELHAERKSMLKRIYHQSKHHQVRQRAHSLLLWGEGYKISAVQEILGVSRKTIYNWFKEWEERGLIGLYNRHGRGRKPTFTQEQQGQIRRWTEENLQQLKQVSSKIKTEWDITISTKTIKRVLKCLGMSWHRMRRVVGGEPNPVEYAAKKKQLDELKRLDTLGEVDLYYLDEAGFCLIPSVPYGWQPVGETVGIPSQHSRRLNVLGIMNRRNQLHSYISSQSINSDVLIACINSFFPIVNKRTVIVMDRAPFHTSDYMYDQLQEWQERQIEIFSLPTPFPV